MKEKIENEVIISATALRVWQTITVPERMKRWMGDPEMDLEIETNWEAGTPMIIRGFHHVRFESGGKVLVSDWCRQLSYTHLSSISHLPDVPESYTVINFFLDPADENTRLRLEIENFPTESIYRHLNFYWPATMTLIKKTAEEPE